MTLAVIITNIILAINLSEIGLYSMGERLRDIANELWDIRTHSTCNLES